MIVTIRMLTSIRSICSRGSCSSSTCNARLWYTRNGAGGLYSLQSATMAPQRLTKLLIAPLGSHQNACACLSGRHGNGITMGRDNLPRFSITTRFITVDSHLIISHLPVPRRCLRNLLALFHAFPLRWMPPMLGPRWPLRQSCQCQSLIA